MAQATIHFPRGFLWGTATASHQVEGNNTNNDWWAWEQQSGRIQNGDRSGLACDWWNGRWREDFDRAAGCGQNAHRMSIEWSRVQPTPDRWDEAALDRYREMMRGLQARNLTPLVTLHHFTNPLWLQEMGGWENEAVIERYVAYVRKVVDALREYATYWVTINEPNVYASIAYGSGAWPPGKADLGAAIRVLTNMVKAHAAAYKAIHAIQPQARVGVAHQIRPFIARRNWSPFDRLAAWLQSGLFNQLFPQALKTGVMRFPAWTKRVPEAKGTQDFLGVNYYTREYVNFSLLHAGELFGRRSFDSTDETSPTGFIANSPDGLFETLKWANGFGLPILITENGVEDKDDTFRPRYLAEHIYQTWRAVNFNWPVRGYFYWTLVDNFEWERGWTQPFGLWELDVETQTRRKRPSADFYAEICRENGLSSDMVARYAPQALDKLFPG